LKFSNCGRFLASGGADSIVFVWDISTSVIVAQLCSHMGPVYSIEFSRDNSVFVSGKFNFDKKLDNVSFNLISTGGLDSTIKLWNMAKLIKDVEQVEDLSKYQIKNESHYEIGSWCTKQTPIMHLHFTRRNLLVGLGLFKPSN
jgi:transcription initiation factor TFIID subunit 5